MTVVLEAINLRKEFPGSHGEDGVLAVDNISLNVNRGEIYGLLGINGAGKTTTVKMLLGLCFPDRGEIKTVVNDLDEGNHQARIGYVPEEHYFYPHLRVKHFLRLLAQVAGSRAGKPAKMEVTRVTELMEISNLLDKRISNLSKGQRQRVALAQAFLGDPDLVVLDEPGSGLDPLGVKRLSSMLKEFKKTGKTVFMCSHQLSEVELVCDRVGLIKDGKIALEGVTSDLISESNATNLEELFISIYSSGE